MPWHDIHTMLVGPAVMDIAQHFVERWNFCRDLKYKHDERFPLLDWPHDDPLNDQMLRHPWTGRLRQHGTRYRQKVLHLDNRPRGNMNVQICRSVGDWSCGWITEHSIQNAYIQLINEANHFILIENQFFVSWPQPNSTVKNGIAAALVKRILTAANAGQKFKVTCFITWQPTDLLKLAHNIKVMIIIPEIPCFAGDLKASAGTLAIIDAQYRSLFRGKNSIYGMIEAAGFQPRDYVSLFNLRHWDRSKPNL